MPGEVNPTSLAELTDADHKLIEQLVGLTVTDAKLTQNGLRLEFNERFCVLIEIRQMAILRREVQ